MIEAPAGTRQRLLRAAQQLIEEGGYGAASVVAIAGRAGVASGTLYRHFTSKEELFVEVFRSVGDRELSAVSAAAEAVPAQAGQVQRLTTLLETFAARALRRPRLAWALIAEPVDSRVDAERLAYRARYRQLIAHALRQAIAAGEVPAQDVEFTAAALVGGCGEALVGPLASVSTASLSIDGVLAAQRDFVRRAVGAAVAAETPA